MNRKTVFGTQEQVGRICRWHENTFLHQKFIIPRSGCRRAVAQRRSTRRSNVGQPAEFFIGTHRANLVTLAGAPNRSSPRFRPPSFSRGHRALKN